MENNEHKGWWQCMTTDTSRKPVKKLWHMCYGEAMCEEPVALVSVVVLSDIHVSKE